MLLVEQLEHDLANAMRERDQVRLSVLRLLKSAIKNQQIEMGHELSAQEMLAVLQKEAKKRRDSIDAYQKADRADLVEEETSELKTIEGYLPAQMGENDIRAIVSEVIAAHADESPAMGQLIGEVMKRVAGQADGSLVSKLVAEALAN